jgi:hypothetical protein
MEKKIKFYVFAISSELGNFFASGGISKKRVFDILWIIRNSMIRPVKTGFLMS